MERKDKKLKLVIFIILEIFVLLITNIVINNVLAFSKYLKVNKIDIFGYIFRTTNIKPFEPTLNIRFISSKEALITYAVITFMLLLLLLIQVIKNGRSLKKINKDIASDRLTTIKELKEQYKEIPLKEKKYKGKPGVVISRHKDKLYIDDVNSNVLCIGTTRSGKGETFLLPSVDAISRAEEQASMVFNDPKGELFTITSKSLEKRGYNTEVLNIFNPTSSMCWNPLTEIYNAYEKGKLDEAQNLANSFTFAIYLSKELKDPYFNEAAAKTVSAVILAMAKECVENKIPEKFNMYCIARLISELTTTDDDEESQSMLDKYIDTLPLTDPARTEYATMKTARGKTKASVLSTMLAGLSIFTYSDIARMTSKTNVNLNRIGFNIKERYIIEATDQTTKKVYKYYSPHEKYFTKEACEEMLDVKVRNGLAQREYTYTVDDIKSLDPFGYTDIHSHLRIKYNFKEDDIDSTLESLYASGYINNYRNAHRYYAFNQKTKYLNQIRNFEDKYYIKELLEKIDNGLEIDEEINSLDFVNITEVVESGDTKISILEITKENECIIPQKSEIEMQYLTEKEKQVYKEIVDRFLMNMLPNYVVVTEREIIKSTIPLVNTKEYVIQPGYKLISEPTLIKQTLEKKENDEIELDNFEYKITEAFENKPTALYMIVPDFDKSKHILASMFITQLYSMLNKKCLENANLRTDRTVYMFLDEFGSMPIIESMDSKITVNLSRWIIFVLFVQSYNQLNKYGDAGKVIKENCGTKIFIQSNDGNTIEEISEKVGVHTVSDISKSGKYLASDKSESEHLKEKRILPKHEIEKIKANESIVLRTSKRFDLKGRGIKPYAIYNHGETELIPRHKYLDNFKQTENLYALTSKKYAENNISLDSILYVPKYIQNQIKLTSNESVEKSYLSEEQEGNEDNIISNLNINDINIIKCVFNEIYGESQTKEILKDKELTLEYLEKIPSEEIQTILQNYK